jgi:cephalosporin hydroxylase
MEKPNLEDSLAMSIKDWLYYHQNNVHFNQKYRGLNMIKNPFDLVIYEELFWEIKPTVVIEIGNRYGGFSLWLRDRMKLVGVDGKIITIDIEPLADGNFKEYKSDKFISIVGDCNSSETIEKVKKNIKKDDVVMIVEDSSHAFDNTYKVLENYKDIVTVGSYLVIEDGICDIIDLGVNPGPMKAVEEWINDNKEFEIDRSKERYIMTYNPKGYLKRIK